jgi:hypothetical protein
MECFAKSSNIGFAKVGKRCGTALYETARSLGFGVPTGVGLPGESSGLLRHPKRWSGRSAPTLAIGYEVMVTPLQLAMAYGAVANDGVLMRPQLVKEITDADGNVVYRGRPEPIRRVMEPSVARTVRTFMRRVMTDGTGTAAELEWVEIGGKTGTAEKLVDGQYSGNKHYASFAGIAPINDPRLVCVVMLDEPQGANFGGSAAAPVFRQVLEGQARLRGALLAPEYDTVIVPGGGQGMRLGPPDAFADEKGRRLSGPPTGENGLPELRNLSLREALRTLQSYGLMAEVTGHGVVVGQEPLPGTDPDSLAGPVHLECAPPPARATLEEEDDSNEAAVQLASTPAPAKATGRRRGR